MSAKINGGKWIAPATRLAILVRDSFTCRYCGTYLPAEVSPHIDHVTPRNKGGTHHPSNLVTSCAQCNERKGDRSPEKAGLRRPYVRKLTKAQRQQAAVVLLWVLRHQNAFVSIPEAYAARMTAQAVANGTITLD